jgi:vancomycin resistance protein YoaR
MDTILKFSIRYRSNTSRRELDQGPGKHHNVMYKSNTPSRELDQVPVKHHNVMLLKMYGYYIEVHVQRRINNIKNTASECFPGT